MSVVGNDDSVLAQSGNNITASNAARGLGAGSSATQGALSSLAGQQAASTAGNALNVGMQQAQQNQQNQGTLTNLYNSAAQQAYGQQQNALSNQGSIYNNLANQYTNQANGGYDANQASNNQWSNALGGLGTALGSAKW